MKFPHKVLNKFELSDRIIVVYSWNNLSEETEPRVWENAECFDKKGNKLWTVNGMESHPYYFKKSNMFVGIDKIKDDIIIHSFRGYSYYLDTETGKVTYEGFYK